jgi:hypothetical protein
MLPFRLLAAEDIQVIFRSNLLATSVLPDEGYSGNASCVMRTK